MSERVSPTDSGLYMIVCVWVCCYNNSDWFIIIVLLYTYSCVHASMYRYSVVSVVCCLQLSPVVILPMLVMEGWI